MKFAIYHREREHAREMGDPKLAEVDAPTQEQAERMTAHLGATGTLPPYSSDRSNEEIYSDISNLLSRTGFEVDVDPKSGGRLEIFVRWLRKFRDSAPPFTIPVIPHTVGRRYRKP